MYLMKALRSFENFTQRSSFFFMNSNPCNRIPRFRCYLYVHELSNVCMFDDQHYLMIEIIMINEILISSRKTLTYYKIHIPPEIQAPSD